MIRKLFLTILLVPGAVVGIDELTTAPHARSLDFPEIITIFTPIVLFLMGLLAKPLLENTVNSKIEEIEERFSKMEKDAHGEIVKSIEKSQEEYAKHNSNEFAHPNLSIFDKLSEKIDRLAIELEALRIAVAELSYPAVAKRRSKR